MRKAPVVVSAVKHGGRDENERSVSFLVRVCLPILNSSFVAASTIEKYFKL